MNPSKCEHCQVPTGKVAPYEVWRSGCPATKTDDLEHRGRIVAECLRVGSIDGVTGDNPTRALIVYVELCDFRHSSCGCLGKPARCRLGGYTAMVTLDDCRACLAHDSKG